MPHAPVTFQTTLAALKSKQLYRRRTTLTSAQGCTVEVDGKSLHNFTSNDYLGLANHLEIAKAMVAGVQQYGVGSGAAHLISGHTQAHEDLEHAFADFFATERALLFSTGYMANLGVVNALLDRHGALFADKLNHASLVDAGKQTDATVCRYTHGDMTELSDRLAHTTASGRRLIATDGVFSMDGDVADIAAISDLAAKHQAEVLVDEAHSFGVLGAQGVGLVAGQDLAMQPIIMATCGKALGTAGAVVAGSEDFIEFLIQKARPYIYTTAMPAALAVASKVALTLLSEADNQRKQLQELVTHFREGMHTLGFEILQSQTPIQGIVLADAAQALALAAYLRAKGILVQAIRPPTVATARLRITFSATHTIEMVDGLLDALAGYHDQA